MSQRILLILVVVLSLVVACSDDESGGTDAMDTTDTSGDTAGDMGGDTATDTGGDTATDTGDDTATDTGDDTTTDMATDTATDTAMDTTDDMAMDTTMDMTRPDGNCTNMADDMVHRNADVQARAEACGRSCIADQDKSACTSTCLQGDPGLSEGCADCYGDIGECTIDNCIGQCALNPSGMGCRSCVEMNCAAAFVMCSGLME